MPTRASLVSNLRAATRRLRADFPVDPKAEEKRSATDGWQDPRGKPIKDATDYRRWYGKCPKGYHWDDDTGECEETGAHGDESKTKEGSEKAKATKDVAMSIRRIKQGDRGGDKTSKALDRRLNEAFRAADTEGAKAALDKVVDVLEDSLGGKQWAPQGAKDLKKLVEEKPEQAERILKQVKQTYLKAAASSLSPKKGDRYKASNGRIWVVTSTPKKGGTNVHLQQEDDSDSTLTVQLAAIKEPKWTLLSGALKAAAEKVDPQSYHKEHGKCPPGYHFSDADGKCVFKEKAKGTRREDTKAEKVKEQARSFLKSADANTRAFFTSPEHREKTTKVMAKTMTKLPATLAKRLVHAAKDEVHEFKTAGKGLKSLVSGKPLDDHHKKALKTVGVHMAISVAAAAATSSGVGIAAGVAKAMARGVVAKAIAPVFVKMHLGEELTHAAHLFAADDEGTGGDNDLLERIRSAEDPMLAYTQEISKAVGEALASKQWTKDELVKLAAKSG